MTKSKSSIVSITPEAVKVMLIVHLMSGERFSNPSFEILNRLLDDLEKEREKYYRCLLDQGESPEAALFDSRCFAVEAALGITYIVNATPQPKAQC